MKTSEFRKLIREEIKNQLKEYSSKDFVARYQSTNIIIKNAYIASKDDKFWDNMYADLAVIAIKIGRETKNNPKEIVITLK